MKVLIFGSGMYVTGKGHSNTGTILTSVIQSSLNINIEQIDIISYSTSSKGIVHESASHTNKLLGTNVAVNFFSLEDKEQNWLQDHIASSSYHMAIVSLPDHLHYEYAKLCIENGLHTLVVKPLTPTSNEATDLIKLAKDHQVYGAVEFHKRWDESNLYLKSSIEDGRIGELLYFDVNYSQRIIIPSQQFRLWSEKTNIFQYLGIHYVDLIHFMTGAIPKSISAYGTKKKLKSMGIDTYDSVHVSSVWGDSGSDTNNFYAHFNLNWIDPNDTTAMSDQRISVVGTEGRIDCDQKNRGIYEVTNANGAQSINPYFSSWIAGSNGNKTLNGYGFKSIKTFIEDVADLLISEVDLDYLNQNRPSFSDALVSTQFIEKVNQSLNSKK